MIPLFYRDVILTIFIQMRSFYAVEIIVCAQENESAAAASKQRRATQAAESSTQVPRYTCIMHELIYLFLLFPFKIWPDLFMIMICWFCFLVEEGCSRA